MKLVGKQVLLLESKKGEVVVLALLFSLIVFNLSHFGIYHQGLVAQVNHFEMLVLLPHIGLLLQLLYFLPLLPLFWRLCDLFEVGQRLGLLHLLAREYISLLLVNLPLLVLHLLKNPCQYLVSLVVLLEFFNFLLHPLLKPKSLVHQGWISGTKVERVEQVVLLQGFDRVFNGDADVLVQIIVHLDVLSPLVVVI